jgi:hypothetical protein
MRWRLPDLVNIEKSIVFTPKWVEVGSRFELSFPLQIEETVVEGLEVRAKALKEFPDRAVCFNFQYHPANEPCVPLTRIEWNPLRDHTNPIDHSHPLSGLECGKHSHIHKFSDNWLEHSQRMRTRNLPFAALIEPNPATFAGLLDFVSGATRIKGIGLIETPPWVEGDLLDGL